MNSAMYGENPFPRYASRGWDYFCQTKIMIQDMYLYIMTNQGSLQGIDMGYQDFVPHES
jgi:hypothetical protein